MDTISKAKRSWNMSRIRGKDTSPEKLVRSALHQMGFRFSLHRADLPGKPDIVLPKYQTVVFVHGCFWHQHKGCKRCSIPKSNAEYWRSKLQRNVKRFIDVSKQLSAKGWRIIVVWECKTKNPGKLKKNLAKKIRSKG